MVSFGTPCVLLMWLVGPDPGVDTVAALSGPSFVFLFFFPDFLDFFLVDPDFLVFFLWDFFFCLASDSALELEELLVELSLLVELVLLLSLLESEQ